MTKKSIVNECYFCGDPAGCKSKAMDAPVCEACQERWLPKEYDEPVTEPSLKKVEPSGDW